MPPPSGALPPMPPPPGGAFPPPGPFVTPGTPLSPTGLPLASWGIRFGGYLIDLVLFVVVQLIVGGAFRHTHALRVQFTMTQNDGTVRQNTYSILAILISGLITVLYSTLFLGSRGQTLGMMAVSIRAVRAEDDGNIGMGRALGRSVVQVVLAWTIIVGLLSDLFPLWDAKRQTLADKAAGTLVVRGRPVR